MILRILVAAFSCVVLLALLIDLGMHLCHVKLAHEPSDTSNRARCRDKQKVKLQHFKLVVSVILDGLCALQDTWTWSCACHGPR
jgi:hypothetical protein